MPNVDALWEAVDQAVLADGVKSNHEDGELTGLELQVACGQSPKSRVPFDAIRAWKCVDADTGKDYVFILHAQNSLAVRIARPGRLIDPRAGVFEGQQRLDLPTKFGVRLGEKLRAAGRIEIQGCVIDRAPPSCAAARNPSAFERNKTVNTMIRIMVADRRSPAASPAIPWLFWNSGSPQ